MIDPAIAVQCLVIWRFMLLSVDSDEFLQCVIDADEKGDDETVEALICGAVKHLRANRAKPDPGLYLGLMHLAKTRPECFVGETMVEVSDLRFV